MAAPPYTFFHYGTPATIVQAQPHNSRLIAKVTFFLCLYLGSLTMFSVFAKNTLTTGKVVDAFCALAFYKFNTLAGKHLRRYLEEMAVTYDLAHLMTMLP